MTDQKELFEFDYEPIRGYPELRWTGKRPFTGTPYYPAQLKESYGDDVDGWRNKIYWGDNLQVMSHLLKSFRGKVNLIYIDPPFDSKADYKKKIELRGKSAQTDSTTFEEKQYGDIWTNDEYLQFMYERLILCRELLADNGSIYLHCDWHRNSYLRNILDEIFGINNFQNEIVWRKSNSHNDGNKFGCITESIYFYTKTSNFIYNKQFYEMDERSYDKTEPETGRKYKSVSMNAAGSGEPRYFGKKLLYPPVGTHWRWSQERINDALTKNPPKIVFTANGVPRYKQYMDEMEGNPVQNLWADDMEELPIENLWMDFMAISSQAQERLDYPTQKPEALLERIIKASSNPGDLVFDCFMGSGTTQAVAMKLGRRFIGADINLGAIQTTTKRLLKVAEEIRVNPDNDTLFSRNAGGVAGVSPAEGGVGATKCDAGGRLSPADSSIRSYYTGFEVYNVNDYEFFRNELEAKRLICEAMGMERLTDSNVYDALLDGRKVCILGINRIATASEFARLLSNVDVSVWQERQKENPARPVEAITFVCMGHDPNLKAQFEEEVAKLGFKVDLEIIDLLRDKKDLRFKRDSDAKVVVRSGKLVIENFFPMNLLQKLSIEKTDVSDWKELAESVFIDWNYDGVTFCPSLTDIPEKNALVKGEYGIPQTAGAIHIKITDLLSESWECTVQAEEK